MIDGAGLGLAVGNQHLAHMHAGQYPLHDLHRTGRSGHDAGPQAAQLERAEPGMVQFSNKHGGHPVQRGAALLGYGRQGGFRLEGLAGKNRGTAVSDTGQVGHDHTEAVVQRHRYAQPVGLGQAHTVAHQLTVVEDIAMGEGGALGVAGGAAGELDIDRVAGGQSRRDSLQLRALRLPAHGTHGGEVVHTRARLIAHTDDRAQVGQSCRLELTRFTGGQFRRQLFEHGQVIAALELTGADHRLALYLVEGVFQFVGAIGRIDTHHDGADPGGGKLGQAPLVAIGCPYANPVAGFDAQGQQAAGEALDLLLVFPVRPAHTLVAHNQRLDLGKPVDGTVKSAAYGLLEQRLAGGAAQLAEDKLLTH